MTTSPRRTWPALRVAGLESEDQELLQADLLDFDVEAIDETASDGWRIFFRTHDARDAAARQIRAQFAPAVVEALDVDDEDWAARSQASLKAVTVGRIVVAPPWDVPLTLVIQPSMGFGTGHHATTRQCLAALQRRNVSGRRVIDVGTGSGVLAIAASRLGAADVQAFDDDPDAIQAAWENLALNPGASVTLQVGDIRTLQLDPADLLLANITGALLAASAPEILGLAAPDGYLILSGFQTHEVSDVTAAFAPATVVDQLEEDSWVALTLRK